MSLVRQQLREELVAIIAAGRELSPEHDYLLADIYLSRTRAVPRPRSSIAQWLDHPRVLRTLLAVACLALAALAFSLLAFHGDRAGAAPDGGAVVPHAIDRDDGYIGPGYRWNPTDGAPPFGSP